MKDDYVVTLGLADVDECYQCTTPLLPGAKYSVRKEEVLPGGLVVGAAGVLRMLGGETYLLSTLGEDEYTDFLTGSLKQLQIDTRYAEWLTEYRNLRVTIYLSKEERAVFIRENDKPPVMVNDEMRESLRNADFLYMTIYNLGELESYRELMGGVKRGCTRITVDAEPATFPDRESGEGDSLFRMTGIISFNEVSYEEYCKGSDVDFAKKLAGGNSSIVVMTMGKWGCRICGDRKEYHIPTFRVKAVNTTGAGDTHNGAFLYGHLRDWGIKRAGVFTAVAAVWAVTGKRAQAGVAPERTVLGFLERLQCGDG